VAALAEAPLRRRALEKQGMTREQELELLIQEQQADDIYTVSSGISGRISLDGSVSSGEPVSELVGIVDGQILSFLPRSRESLFLVSLKHASFDAYNNKGCRCRQCKNFMAEYRRAKRAA